MIDKCPPKYETFRWRCFHVSDPCVIKGRVGILSRRSLSCIKRGIIFKSPSLSGYEILRCCDNEELLKKHVMLGQVIKHGKLSTRLPLRRTQEDGIHITEKYQAIWDRLPPNLAGYLRKQLSQFEVFGLGL